MMTQEYVTGFCKMAAALDVDPQALAKEAGISEALFGSGQFPFDPGLVQKLMANEHLRRALTGAAAAGTTAVLTSGKNKWRNALLAALGGGVATYGASATGVLDNMPRVFNNGVREMKARDLTWKQHGSPKQPVDPRQTLAFLKDFSKRHAEKTAQAVEVRPGTHAIGNDRLERLGRYSSILGTAALGSGIGYLSGKDGGTGKGALIGAGAGVAANIIAKLVAAIRKSRTAEEQQAHDNEFRNAGLVVPGVAAYNEAKRDEREKIHAWH